MSQYEKHNSNDCLHCRLQNKIADFFYPPLPDGISREQLKDVIKDVADDVCRREIIEALAQIFADLLVVADAKERSTMRPLFDACIADYLDTCIAEKHASQDEDGSLLADYLKSLTARLQ